MARLLFACPSRYGDIILGSIFSNMLAAMGYEVTDLVLRAYYPFHTRVLKGEHRTLLINEPTDWFSVTQPFLRGLGPYDYYINAQPGSPENHDRYLSSGLSATAFIHNEIEKALSCTLPSCYTDYLYFDTRFLAPVHSESEAPVLLIAPHSISVAPAINRTIIRQLQKEFPHYRHKVVLPTGTKPLYHLESIFCPSFSEAVVAVLAADYFVGNDSGLSWAALYNPQSQKRIYHHSDRMHKVNNRFQELDAKAVDVILK